MGMGAKDGSLELFGAAAERGRGAGEGRMAPRAGGEGEGAACIFLRFKQRLGIRRRIAPPLQCRARVCVLGNGVRVEETQK
jgi:hypothetical protein